MSTKTTNSYSARARNAIGLVYSIRANRYESNIVPLSRWNESEVCSHHRQKSSGSTSSNSSYRYDNLL